MDPISLARKPHHLYNSTITIAYNRPARSSACYAITALAASHNLIDSNPDEASYLGHSRTPKQALPSTPQPSSLQNTQTPHRQKSENVDDGVTIPRPSPTHNGPSTFYLLPDFFLSDTTPHCVGIEFLKYGYYERCFTPCSTTFLCTPCIREEIRAARRCAWGDGYANGAEERMRVWEMVDGWFGARDRQWEVVRSVRAALRGKADDKVVERVEVTTEEDLRRDLVEMGIGGRGETQVERDGRVLFEAALAVSDESEESGEDGDDG